MPVASVAVELGHIDLVSAGIGQSVVVMFERLYVDLVVRPADVGRLMNR